jgi:translation initiation factor eIF-2B subunit delta
MSTIQNLVTEFLYQVTTYDKNDLGSVIKYSENMIKNLIKKYEKSIKESIKRANTIKMDSDIFATCSYSSTICKICKAAKQIQKNFTVYIAESQSYDKEFYHGRKLANYLKSIDVPFKIFRDSEIQSYIKDVNYALVGADSVLFDGSIINGTPTGQIAKIAKKYNIPVFVICETSKMNIPSYLKKEVKIAKGFDLVSGDLIDGIISEKGIISNNQIREVMKIKSKFFEVIEF